MGVMLDYLWSLLPPWLSKPRGRRFTKAFGQRADALRDDATFGVKEAMIEECTVDAYPAHLRNSNLQVIAGEAAVTQLAQLRRRWLTWRESGGYEGMIHAINRLGYANVVVTATLDLKISGHPGAFGNLRNFFYVEIDQPNFWTPGEHWHGGKKWRDDRALWGLGGGTREQLEELFYTIRKFKPFTHSCRFVAIEVTAGVYRILPMNEPWELQPNGAYNEFYNLSFSVP